MESEGWEKGEVVVLQSGRSSQDARTRGQAVTIKGDDLVYCFCPLSHNTQRLYI